MENQPIDPTIHTLMIALVLFAVVLLVKLGSGHTIKENSDRFDLGVASTLGLIWVLYNIYYFSPDVFDWGVSLPLHVCDLLGFVAVLALVSSRRVWRTVLYFSATLLAGQAVVTPVGNQDPETIRFWLFWFLHAGIISASWYDILVRKYRPQLGDLGICYLANLVYISIVLPFNVATGFNYGYLGNATPDGASIIDLLGQWPDRVFYLIAIAMVAQALMFIPWVVIRRLITHSKD